MELTKAIAIATNRLIEHGLFDKGWCARLGRGSRRLGACFYKRKIIKIARHHILNGSDEEVMDTIMHEIAHALVGPDVKQHGPEWQNCAIKLGANPRPTLRVKYKIPQRYALMCGKCNSVLQHRINKVSDARMDRMYCKFCGITASKGHLFIKNITNATTSIL